MITLIPQIIIGLSTLSQILLIIWSVHHLKITQDDQNSFGRHPILLYGAFQYLSLISITSFQNLNGITERHVNKSIHWILHLISLILGLWGIIDAFEFHSSHSITHFQSIHSWLGLLLYVMQLIMFITSAVAFLGPENEFKKGFVEWHRPLGIGFYAIAAIVVITGTLEKITFIGVCSKIYANGLTQCQIVNAFSVLTVINVILVILWFHISKMEKKKEKDEAGGQYELNK